MLPSINLQSTDFTAFTGDPAGDAQAPLDADTPVGGFAELLNQPLPADDSAVDIETDSVVAHEAGEELPSDGNMLPADTVESLLMPEQPGGQTTRGDGTPLGAFPGELPIVRMAPPAALTNQAASPANPEVQVVAASLMTRPGQGQLAGAQTGAASVAAALESLTGRPASANSLLSNNQGVANRPGETVAGTRQVTGLNSIDNTILPASALDADASLESLRTIAGSSQDPLSGLIERWQGSASTQSLATSPPPIAVAPGLTAVTQAPLALASPAALPLAVPIDTPLQSAAWGDALSDRVLFMTNQKISSAEIRLNPAELGPITITVAVDGKAADVTFHAQHAAARDAIELAMPRLRELLSENGLQLGNASVAERGVDQDARGDQAQEARGWNDTADDGLPHDEAGQIVPLRLSQGLVDTFV